MDISPQAALTIGLIVYKLTRLALCFMSYCLLVDVKSGSSDASVSWKRLTFSLQGRFLLHNFAALLFQAFLVESPCDL
jgi:hypothetical protein